LYLQNLFALLSAASLQLFAQVFQFLNLLVQGVSSFSDAACIFSQVSGFFVDGVSFFCPLFCFPVQPVSFFLERR
jgi:hypothetical protein